MKSLRKVLGLAFLTMLILGVAYPLTMIGIAHAISLSGSEGNPIYKNDTTLVGFEQIGQNFKSPKYFWGRPSAVNYNASATGGSNLGPSNPKFLKLVQSRIDTLLLYNQGLKIGDIPVDLVTSSASGLDPDISKQAALIQVKRVAKARNLSPQQLNHLIDQHTHKPLLGIFGPGNYVNVLKINLALDKLDQNTNTKQ